MIRNFRRLILCENFGLNLECLEDDNYDGDIWLGGFYNTMAGPTILKEFSKLGIDTVRGNFGCEYQSLESLEGMPRKIIGDVYFGVNKIRNLEHCSKIIQGGFYFHSNDLYSLEGLPEGITDYDLTNNNNLPEAELVKIQAMVDKNARNLEAVAVKINKITSLNM